MCQSLYMCTFGCDANLPHLSRSAVCFASRSSGRLLTALGAGLAAAATGAFAIIYASYAEVLAYDAYTFSEYTWLETIVAYTFFSTGAVAAAGTIGAPIQAILNSAGTYDEAVAEALNRVQTLASYATGNGTAIMETYGWVP